jgi:hypothetical protein
MVKEGPGWKKEIDSSAVRHDLTKRLVRTFLTHASHKIEMKKKKTVIPTRLFKSVDSTFP